MLVAPSGSAKAKDLLPVVAVGLGDPGVIHGIFFWNAMKEPPDLLFVDVLSFRYYVRLSIVWFVCVFLQDMEYPSWTTTHIIHVCILTCYRDGLCSKCKCVNPPFCRFFLWCVDPTQPVNICSWCGWCTASGSGTPSQEHTGTITGRLHGL